MDGLMVIFLVVVAVLGIGVLALVGYGRSTGKQLDVDKYRRSWLTIERQLTKGNEASYSLAILNADKLLDSALRARGFKGETMGERMKSAKQSWSSANNVWSAHKLRNQIAHETHVDISYQDARRALQHFKQALKDVGAV